MEVGDGRRASAAAAGRRGVGHRAPPGPLVPLVPRLPLRPALRRPGPRPPGGAVVDRVSGPSPGGIAMRSILGRVADTAGVLAFVAAVAAVVAAGAHVPPPKDHDRGLCCTAPGCTHRPGWDEIARVLERDRIPARIGAIGPDEQVPD